MDFKIGQRWVSHTEAVLGLGLVAEVSGRRVTISFPAAAEERTYATDNAPLARVSYQAGETIQTHEAGELEVIEVSESEGLLFYTARDQAGVTHELSELKLSPFAQFTTPQQRLFAGQMDKNAAFQLRFETLGYLAHLQQSPVQGLLGSRTRHLPHQVYIASEVAKRYAPRVLLADEVGLGKTIEAGMILHYQLHTGRARRVLIVVPDTLLHQWLVEMLRRFNLHFSIFDQSRYDALVAAESDYELDENDQPVLIGGEGEQNPFETEQLVLCSLDFLTHNAEARAQAIAAGWDLMVVDEAHHLEWSPAAASPQYTCVEELARQSKGLLLLTATPEQVGQESHFARLRLLDPARFHDLASFREEEANYQVLNQLVQELLNCEGALSTTQLDRLEPYLRQEAEQLRANPAQFDVQELVAKLLDRHGTGRVLFRNTRAVIQGFPERRLKAEGLPLSPLYESAEQCLGSVGLTPESTVLEDDWLAEDPRVAWLESLLTGLKPAKVLVICARPETAVALERHLQLRAGIRSAAFHEGLSIVERDRAAAYFAETGQGAQALVCSEIGSEGRNFQFSHHLVLFDLPQNPDLLEQRIGRLDRIGQSAIIDIHVPYLEGSSQEVLFRWYQEGLDAFSHSCVVGVAVRDAVAGQLEAQLAQPDAGLEELLAATARITAEFRQALENGRDPLLEINSCNRPKAEALIEQIEAEENTPALAEYMERAFGQYGVETEDHSDEALILRPSEHMLTGYFPGLPEQGVTVTYDRELALVREDMTFLSWEHPMVVETLDMITTTELGNAALATITVKGVQAGTVLLETVFAVHCPAPRELQLARFLPLRPVRLLMDAKGRDLSHVLPHGKLNELAQDIKRRTAQAIVPQVRGEVEKMIVAAQSLAREQLSGILRKATDAMNASLGAEIGRLRALQEVNPAIRDEEIEFLEQQVRDSAEAIGHASIELQALRVVVST